MIVGGDDQDIETGTDTSRGGTTVGVSETYTTTESDAESDPGDSSNDSTSEVGTNTISSTDPLAENSAFSESMTDTVGAGGVLVGGSLTQTYSDSDGTSLSISGTLTTTTTLTDSTTETDNISENFNDTLTDDSGSEPDVGDEAGTDTTTGYETDLSSSTGTLTEVLGADGTIVSGAESDSLSESSGSTTTETDHPTETTTESASDVTMTLTSTVTNSDTANESDQDWACETLGMSGTISGGSDCFTVSNLETSGYTSTGSGPENYNDTSSTPNGTATVNGSGKSSDFTYQKFGDLLGGGGDISSGSLTYTVTSSETDAATTTETGTETIADEITLGPSQTASYSVTTTMPESASDWETGTETLGGGGTISTGTASFSWSVGDSLSRNLAVNGIAAILSIKENSTDTYGFGESGTETITTGGADAPGTVSFLWEQMGTDSYTIQQGNSMSNSYPISASSQYLLNLLDTASSSWNDTGIASLTVGETVVGETDTYSWVDRDSVSDGVTETEVVSATLGTGTYTGGGMESFSLTDTGTESLSSSEPTVYSMSLVSETDRYTILDSVSNQNATWASWTSTWEPSLVGTSSDVASDGYSLEDVGQDSQSDFTIGYSQSYTVGDWDYYSSSYNEGGTISVNGYLSDSGPFESIETSTSSYSLGASGTDTLSPGGTDSSMSYQTISSATYSDSESWSVPTDAYTIFGEPVAAADVQNIYAANGLTQSGGSGWVTESGGHTTLYSVAASSGFDSYTDHQNYAGYPYSYYDDLNYNEFDDTAYVSGNDESGFSPTIDDSHSGYLSESGAFCNEVGVLTSLYGLPEYDNYPDLLSEIEYNQSPTEQLTAYYSSGSLGLYDAPAVGLVPYAVPDLVGPNPRAGGVPLGDFLRGTALDFRPATNRTNGAGLPSEEATVLGNVDTNTAPPDGVSRDAPPTPTATLVALAAAGRNPTDITLPTVGSQAVDPPPGSHLFGWLSDAWDQTKAATYEFVVVQGGQALTAVKDTGEGLYAVATSAEARQEFAKTFDETARPTSCGTAGRQGRITGNRESEHRDARRLGRRGHDRGQHGRGRRGARPRHRRGNPRRSFRGRRADPEASLWRQRVHGYGSSGCRGGGQVHAAGAENVPDAPRGPTGARPVRAGGAGGCGGRGRGSCRRGCCSEGIRSGRCQTGRLLL